MAVIAARSLVINERRLAHWFVSLLLLLFVLVCIFDPANLLTGAKLPLFIALWPATAISLVLSRSDVALPAELLAYVLAFIAIPLASILWYYVVNGSDPFEGFQLFKGYLLISLALVLYLNRIDLVPQLAMVLSALAALSVAIFVFVLLAPDQYLRLYYLGVGSGLLILDRREYGANLHVLQVYLVTSPMLLFSLAYYFHRARMAERLVPRLAFWGLVGLNLAGALVGGTRNNILAGLLLPFLLWPVYSRNVTRTVLVSAVLLSLLALPFIGQLRIFFDIHEAGNSVRFELLRDYRQMFENPLTLLLGQGLGAYQHWGARGYQFYTAEPTYLELVRNFGLFGAVAMMTLLVMPLSLALSSGSRLERALAISYAVYLVICVTNPNLFSSMGVLILSILLANGAMARTAAAWTGAAGPSLFRAAVRIETALPTM